MARSGDRPQLAMKTFPQPEDGDEEGRHELVKLIVEKVYVQDDKVVAMTLRSNYHLVLNHKTNGPTEFSVDPSFVTCGSDGLRYRARCICIVWVLYCSW